MHISNHWKHTNSFLEGTAVCGSSCLRKQYVPLYIYPRAREDRWSAGRRQDLEGQLSTRVPIIPMHIPLTCIDVLWESSHECSFFLRRVLEYSISRPKGASFTDSARLRLSSWQQSITPCLIDKDKTAAETQTCVSKPALHTSTEEVHRPRDLVLFPLLAAVVLTIRSWERQERGVQGLGSILHSKSSSRHLGL